MCPHLPPPLIYIVLLINPLSDWENFLIGFSSAEVLVYNIENNKNDEHIL